MEDFPWGETVFKVHGKVFVFFGHSGTGLGLSVKLPDSSLVALGLPFASPTGYGLGKSGWVTAQFAAKDAVPFELLKQWIEESYRTVAPKKLVAELDARQTPRTGAPASSTRTRASTRRKTGDRRR
jgi:predicted DNA-binding protein (MmcQ/YjbR family)